MAPPQKDPDQPRWQPAPWTVPEPEDPPQDPTAEMPALGWDPAAAPGPDDDPGPDAGPGPGDGDPPVARERRLGAILGGSIAVLVLLIVLVILAVTLLADDDPPTDDAPVETSTTVAAEADGDREIEIQGVRITIPAGSLDPGAELDVSLRSMPTSHVAAFTPVSPFLTVSVKGGEQRGPIRFEFPVEPGRIGLTDDDPVLLTVLVDDGDVQLHEGRWDASRRIQTVELDRVTDLGVITWDWSRIERIVDGAVDARTGSPHGVLSCGATPPEVRGTSSSAMSWCVDDGEPRVVRGRNVAAHAIDVAWSGARLDGIDDPSAVGDLAGRIPEWTGDGRRTLGPGGSITLLVPVEAEATVSSAFGDQAAAATWVDIHARILSDLAALITPVEAVDVDTLLGQVHADCATTSTSPIELGRNCFDPALRRTIYGEDIEDHLATILTPRIVGRLTDETIEAIRDDLVARSSSSVSVTGARLRGGTWPTGSQDAPQNPDLDWSRCIGHACIAGIGPDVELYRWLDDEWEKVATMPLATDDPAGALLDRGASEAEVRAFLNL